jgi:hypothetical protein
MLVQDMTYRHDNHQLERVLEVMAESEGGREILKSGGQGSVEFNNALAKVLKAETGPTLERVRNKMIKPYENLGKAEAALKLEMRARGVHMP